MFNVVYYKTFPNLFTNPFEYKAIITEKELEEFELVKEETHEEDGFVITIKKYEKKTPKGIKTYQVIERSIKQEVLDENKFKSEVSKLISEGKYEDANKLLLTKINM